MSEYTDNKVGTGSGHKKFYPSDNLQSNKSKSFQSDRTRMANLEKEIVNLKRRLSDIEQRYDGDQSYQTYSEVTVVFAGNISETFKDVQVKKYTLEGKDVRGNTVHIYKNNINYYRPK